MHCIIFLLVKNKAASTFSQTEVYSRKRLSHHLCANLVVSDGFAEQITGLVSV